MTTSIGSPSNDQWKWADAGKAGIGGGLWSADRSLGTEDT